ncbi:TAP-like protein-domain-containing protein [Hypoxylon rubiginosum]|uniref:TAP-like protein-domain-containing protein n=1 Tax=Hypoxylon rubiginosum TaxID=110542 RepID=A0ACB9Z4R2_9PEZI|nr:TAP-like protein-domain-containing protein [Hypoxylon rubiginosum]
MRSVVEAGLLLAALGRHAAAQTFDWASIQPSTSLNYTTCYDTLKCAKLSVPLDWLNPTNNTARVSLAVVARPATVPESDPSFGGTIIVNPGGPGGSGVDFVLSSGALLQGIADGDARHYEILSFDPRGVALSEPRADCYGDEFARAVTTLQLRAMGPVDGGIDVVRRQQSLIGSLGRLCEGGDEIHAYMSTSSVARDMVEIVDKIDELRKANTTVSARSSRGGGPRRLRQRRQQEKEEVARIQYWGFSYGTVLGNYFASMYPGRVGRMILEGVVDVHDYSGALWEKNLQDTQEDWDTFFTSCFEGGSACALHTPNVTSPGDIRRRVEAFLEELRTSPAQHISGSNIDEITRQDVVNIIFQALYQPMQYFPLVATGLADAMAGNFSLVWQSLGLPQSAAGYCPSTLPQSYTWSQDALLSVACGDAPAPPDADTAGFLAYLAELQAQSPDFAAGWTQVRLGCDAWRVRPTFRFAGPWTTPAADPSGNDTAKPQSPILFLSSRYDPVTPHANAVAMAAEHAGARVLVQDNAGHGTLGTPGKCRDDYVKSYFATGELPPEGTVCDADCKPFQDCPQVQLARRALGVRDNADSPVIPHRQGPLNLFG